MSKFNKGLQILNGIVTGIVNTAHNEIFIKGKYKPNKPKKSHKTEKNYYIVHHHWNSPKRGR